MAVTARTRAGLAKFPAVERGGRVALVAPASPFDRAEFDRGVVALTGLGYEPIIDERVFAKRPMVAGPAALRAAALTDAWTSDEVQAVLGVRGGYGSVETLPLLDPGQFVHRPKAFVGYSDLTSLHIWLNCHLGLASVHGAMVIGRLATGAAAYDADSFVRSLGRDPLGEITAETLDVIRPGEARGPLVGGTLTQLVSSLGTPYDFTPPPGSVLFIDEVGERPYRLQRMLVHLRSSGRLAGAAAIIFGQLPRCDEPDGLTARQVLDDLFAEFPGPVLVGFPSGHTTSPLVSVPFGVEVRVVATGEPRVVFEEAAAE